MKINLPIFSALIACLAPVGLATAQTASSSSVSTTAVNGNALMASAVAKMLAQPALEAKIRQRSELFGRRLEGTGIYRQLGSGSNMVRMELKLSAGGQQVASLLEVCDGQYAYLRRDHLDRTSLTRINMSKVRQAVEASSQSPALSSPMGPWMALGGLPNLLRGLEQNFHFDTPRAAEYRSVPVWIVRGTWSRKALRRLTGDPSQRRSAKGPIDLSRLPSHLPHEVVITLGRDDLFPLFPYRIEYLRPGDDGAAAGKSISMVTLELFAVRRRPDLSPEFFQYKPGDQEVIDCTAQFIARLRLDDSSN